MPLRVDTGGDPSFSELVRRVRRVAYDAYQISAVSFDGIVLAVNPQRQAAHSPLYDAMLTAGVGDGYRAQFGDAMLRPRRADAQRVKFGVEVDFRSVGDEVRGSLDYDACWFDPVTGASMADAVARSFRDGVAEADLG